MTARRTKRPIKKVSTICSGKEGKGKTTTHYRSLEGACHVLQESTVREERSKRKTCGVPPDFCPHFSLLTLVFSVGSGNDWKKNPFPLNKGSVEESSSTGKKHKTAALPGQKHPFRREVVRKRED